MGNDRKPEREIPNERYFVLLEMQDIKYGGWKILFTSGVFGRR